jgi:hypothetical protein
MAIIVEAPQSLKPKDVGRTNTPYSTYFSNIIHNRLTTSHGILFAVCGLAPVFGRSILHLPSITAKEPLGTSTKHIGVIFCLVAMIDFYRAATVRGADMGTTFGNAIWSFTSVVGAFTRKRDVVLFLQQAVCAGLFTFSGIVRLSGL